MKKIWMLVSLVLLVTTCVGCTQSKVEDTGKEERIATESNNEDKDKAVKDNKEDSDKEKNEPVEITWLTFETPAFTPEMYDTLIKGFQSINPNIKVKRQVYPTGDRDKYANTLHATGQLPDVLLEGDVDLRAVDGALLEISDDILTLLKDDAINNYSGKVLDLPLSRQIKLNLYYNKKIFAENNLKAPTNWAEFENICATLKEKGITPIIGGGPDKVWLSDALVGSMLQVDMKKHFDNFAKAINDGEIKWTDDRVIEVYDRWKSLIDNDYFHEGSFSFTYAQHVDEFFKGSAAMICNGGWMAKQADTTEGIDFEIGWFPVPGGDNTEYYTAADSNFLSINGATKYPEQAQKLVKYLFENKDANRLFNGNDGSASTTKTPILYEMGPIQKEMFDIMANYEVVFDPFKGEYAYPKGMGNIKYKMAQNLFIGEDVSTELSKFQAEYEAALERAN